MSGLPNVGGLGGLGGLGSYVSAPVRLGGLFGLSSPQKAPRQYPCFEMYVDKNLEWRWRFKASNYKVIADSGEGYKNFEDAQHGMRLMQQAGRAPVYIGD